MSAREAMAVAEKVNNTAPCPELFFAEVCDYVSLRNAIRARVEQLNVSRVCLDDVTGLPAGYSAKLLAPCGKKKIGQLAIDLLLKAAALKVFLVDDREALAKVQPMFVERHVSQARPGNQSRKNKGRPSKAPFPAASRKKKARKQEPGKPYLAR